MPNREIRNVRQGKVSKISKEQLNNINPKTGKKEYFLLPLLGAAASFLPMLFGKSHGGSVGRSSLGGNRSFKKGGKACGK